ncbi:MAG: hypothetical protein ACOYXW_18960 [Actinomycetota bacterium]
MPPVRRTPAWVVAAVAGLVLAVALVLGTWWAALAVLALVAGMALLTAAVWRSLRPPQRALRLLVLGLLVTWAVVQLYRA